MNRRTVIKLALFSLCIFMASTHTSSAQEVLRYNGSSTLLKGIMYKAAKEFKAEEGIEIDLKGKSTGFGIKKLLAGECDIAGGGRPLSAEEKAKGLVETEALSDAYVVVVHPTNPLNEITSQQLAGILQGKITSWDELNGPSGKKLSSYHHLLNQQVTNTQKN